MTVSFMSAFITAFDAVLPFFLIIFGGILSRLLSMLAWSVTPIALFSLGIFMGFQKIGHLREWGHIFFFSLVIMLALPGIFYLVTAHTGWLEGMELKASILEAAMPVGLTPYAL